MKNTEIKFFNEGEKRVCYLPESVQQIKKYFDQNKDATLIISFSEIMDKKNHNDFNDISNINITKLMLSGRSRKEYNYNALLKITKLIELDDRCGNLEYDFKHFPNLEILRLEWNKKTQNLNSLKKIKELSLWSYKPKNQNLSEFENLISLNELRIIQSNIKGIIGIENLKNINELVLIANRALSINEIEIPFNNIKNLYIESCKKIELEKIIKLFPNTRKLHYFSSTPIKSLRPLLDGLKNLEELNIAGTKILETDNRYWKDYKNIKSLHFYDRKHHILKLKDFKG